MSTPIIYKENFVEEPNKVYNTLLNDLAWVQHDKVPRAEYYCNDFPDSYSYGVKAFAREYRPQPWHPEILKIKEKLQWEISATLNCGMKMDVCFLNYYADQTQHLGWHSDDSPEMDDYRPIATISLGAEREIWFRPVRPPAVALDEHPVQKLKLANGSLCLMLPGMQDTHQHRIPKAGHVCAGRISLTFRGYVK